MGCNWKKIQYNEEGAWGSTEVRTLYIKSSRSCGVTTYYDQWFNALFAFGEVENNLLDAIVKSSRNWNDLEDLTEEEFKSIK